MNDLVEFVTARLGEDEEAARAATQGEWAWSREYVTPPGYHHRTVGPLEPGDAVHIARHDPARVLREVEAKRRTLDRHRNCGTGRGFCDDGGHGIDDVGCNELMDLAAPYDDHPDYREEWRP